LAPQGGAYPDWHRQAVAWSDDAGARPAPCSASQGRTRAAAIKPVYSLGFNCFSLANTEFTSIRSSSSSAFGAFSPAKGAAGGGSGRW
jgi:hypothetical protein